MILNRFNIHPRRFFLTPIRAVRVIWRKRVFRNNSTVVIRELQSLLHVNGSFFYFDFGTLMGIFRDGQLLLRDMDIDLSVRIEDQDEIKIIRDLLAQNRFRHKYIFKCEGVGVIQDTFERKGVTVDVNYYRQIEDDDYCYLLYDENEVQGKVLQWRCHHVNTPLKYNFNGIKVNIPDDPEQHLADRYGPSWRIPDPSYKYWENPMAKHVEASGWIETLVK